MARKRMISPEIWDSLDFSKLSNLAKLVFIGLFSQADDEGRGRANAVYIKSKLFPYDEKLRVADIEDTLSEIACHMSTTFYTHNGDRFYSFDNWNVWQKIDRPTKSQFPPPSEDGAEVLTGTLAEHSTNARRTLDERSTNARENAADNKNKNKNKNKKENVTRARACEADSFELFWAQYPRKVAKDRARKVWASLKPTEELFKRIMDALSVQKRSRQWQDDEGRFIPHPCTWLNQRRWEDSVDVPRTDTADMDPTEDVSEIEARFTEIYQRRPEE